MPGVGFLLGLGPRQGGGDSVAPTVVITSDAVEPVSAAFTATFTWSEPVTGFTVDDITASNASLSDFAGSGDTYTVTVTPGNAALTISLSVAAGVCQDLSENLNAASDTLTLDSVIDVDFSTLPDGALPSPLIGEAWTISGGKAVNSPAGGSNLLTDGDMERADLVYWLTSGSPTTKEKSTTEVHGGAQSLHLVADAANEGARHRFAAQNAQWYALKTHVKMAVGQGILSHGLNGVQIIQSAATDWAELAMSLPYAGATTTFAELVCWCAAAGHDGYFDDARAYTLNFESMLFWFDAGQTDVVMKVPLTCDYQSQVAFILNLDNANNPQSYVAGMVWRKQSGAAPLLYLVKVVAGQMSELAEVNLSSYANDLVFEVRKSSTTYQFYYNNVQVGDDVVISDTEISNNTLFGVLSTSGGNSVNRFFVAADLMAVTTAFAGSSVTYAASGYRVMVQDWQRLRWPGYDFTLLGEAVSGANTWNNLIRLPEIAAQSPRVIVWDHANDNTQDLDKYSQEAFIRRAWSLSPQTNLAIVLIASVTNPDDNESITTPVNIDTIEQQRAIAAYYGVPVIDFVARLQELVGEGNDLSTYLSDTVHPTTEGHAVLAEMIEDLYPTLLDGPRQYNGVLPAALYDVDGEYQRDPIIRDGSDHDGTTGTWTIENGTTMVSSEVGATITYTGVTCFSVGIMRPEGHSQPFIEISVDGGMWNNGGPMLNGRIVGSYALHTITFRVLSGTVKIERLFAL